ncbi:6,7-dimethyl-8-ribityllumazine synthase [Alphaproteobacteria bacterium]|nr:6,7-dimethyl-8-ribityllumazine synthase [Alphaproteobacteria bacterium]
MFKNKKVLLVCSPYYKEITQNLVNGAVEVLKLNSVLYKIIHVPGALEIAPSIKIFHEKSSQNIFFDGFIALGCIIRGETYHFEIVSNESARALSELSITYSLPIGNGILTVENKDQAIERSDPAKLNKGAGAALACLSLINHKNNITYE